MVVASASTCNPDQVAAATRGRQADDALGGIQDRKGSTRTWNTDTRLFESEDNGHSIQPCVEKEGQTRSPRVVQCNRLSSDTHRVGIGDTEERLERVGCVGGNNRRRRYMFENDGYK